MFIKLNEQNLPLGDAVSLQAIKNAYPNVSIPKSPTDEQLAELSYGRFKHAAYPEADELSVVTTGEIVLDEDGVWTKEYIVSPVSLADAIALLKRKAGEKRWAVESGGITLGDATIDTSIESQNRVSNAVTNGIRMNLDAVSFKLPDGTFATMTIDELTPIADAMARHVQQCFAAEAAHSLAIADIQDVDAARVYLNETLATGWPA